MTGGPYSGSVIGSAVRYYKNSFDDILALDEITIIEHKRTKLADGTTFVSGKKQTKRTMFYIGKRPDVRTISSVNVLGDYSSYNVTKEILYWNIPTGKPIEIPMGDMPKVGDTV